MTRDSNEPAIEEWAVFVHGATALLHAIGLLHNLRKRNTFDCVVHAAALAYDLTATVTHIRALR